MFLKIYIFCLLLFLPFELNAQSDSVYLEYKTENYKIVLPGNWFLDDSSNTAHEFILYAPQIKPEDEYLSYLTLKKQVIDEHIKINNIEDFAKMSFNMLKLVDSSIKELSSKKITDNSYEFTYSTSEVDEDTKKKVIQVNNLRIIQNGNQIFFLSFTGLTKAYNYYIKEFEYIKSTLDFIE